jgi:MraZ protein
LSHRIAAKSLYNNNYSSIVVDRQQRHPYSIEKWKKVGEEGQPARISRQKSDSRHVHSTVFRGPSNVSLDAKGRMAIPTRYRERIASRCNGELVVTVDKDRCLLLYPLPDWEELERELVNVRGLNNATRRIVRIMVGYATEVDMDNNGRILICKELRKFAGIDRQAMLIGQGKKFELWDEATWNEKCEEWLGDDDDDDLSADLGSISF